MKIPMAFLMGSFLILMSSSVTAKDSFQACIGEQSNTCQNYYGYPDSPLHSIYPCGTTYEQVGKSVCEAMANIDGSYDGRYSTSVIADHPGNQCGYALIFVYCYRRAN